MRRQEPGLRGPLELIKHFPGEPFAASDRRGWVGLQAVRYRYQPPNEAFQPPLTPKELPPATMFVVRRGKGGVSDAGAHPPCPQRGCGAAVRWSLSGLLTVRGSDLGRSRRHASYPPAAAIAGTRLNPNSCACRAIVRSLRSRYFASYCSTSWAT